MTGNSGPMTEAIVRQIPSIVPKGSNLGYIVENYNVGITFLQEDSKDLARVIEKCCLNKNIYVILMMNTYNFMYQHHIQKMTLLYI